MLKESRGRQVLIAMCNFPHISQADVARDVDIAVNSVRQWIVGLCKPSDDARKKLTFHYGIPENLWDEPEDENVLSFNYSQEEIENKLSTLSEEQIINFRHLGMTSNMIAAIVDIFNG